MKKRLLLLGTAALDFELSEKSFSVGQSSVYVAAICVETGTNHTPRRCRRNSGQNPLRQTRGCGRQSPLREPTPDEYSYYSAPLALCPSIGEFFVVPARIGDKRRTIRCF